MATSPAMFLISLWVASAMSEPIPTRKGLDEKIDLINETLTNHLNRLEAKLDALQGSKESQTSEQDGLSQQILRKVEALQQHITGTVGLLTQQSYVVSGKLDLMSRNLEDKLDQLNVVMEEAFNNLQQQVQVLSWPSVNIPTHPGMADECPANPEYQLVGPETCLRFYEDGANYTKAQEQCWNDGATLYTMNTKEQMEMLQTFLSSQQNNTVWGSLWVSPVSRRRSSKLKSIWKMNRNSHGNNDTTSTNTGGKVSSQEQGCQNALQMQDRYILQKVSCYDTWQFVCEISLSNLS